MKEIKRNVYLDKLINKKENGLIKIIPVIILIISWLKNSHFFPYVLIM